MSQRSDEHGGLVSSRWNIRDKLRFCFLQKRHVFLVHKCEVDLELETELQPSPLSSLPYGVGLVASFRTSAMFIVIEPQLRYHAQFICDVIQ